MGKIQKGRITLLRILLFIGVILCLAGLGYILRSSTSGSKEAEMKALQLVQERKSTDLEVTCKETFDNITVYYQHVLFLPLRTEWKVTKMDRSNYIISAQIVGDEGWPVNHWQVDIKSGTILAMEEETLCP